MQGFIKPVSVPRDPMDRQPDEPINLYFGEQFSFKGLAPDYKRVSCPDSIESFIFHLEIARVPYKVVITSRPEFALFQYMYRTDKIYPFSVGESKLNVVRENTTDGIPIGKYITPEFAKGNPDFFNESEYDLYESERKTDNQGRLGYGVAQSMIPAEVVLMALSAYAVAANYIRAHFTHDDLMRMDRNNGILFIVDESGQLHHKIVSGADRPDLTAIVIKDGKPSIEKCRPYYEDSELGKSLDAALGIGKIFPFGSDDEDEMTLEDMIGMAEDGDVDMMDRLMLAYTQGDDELDIEPDPEEACYWMKRLAEAGVSNGAFNLGLHYAKGHGVPRDFVQAAYWMEQAAQLGDDEGIALAEEYRKAQDDKIKAEAGDAQAQADYANILMKLGKSLDEAGPGKDFVESLYWAEKAAAQNNPRAFWVLGLAYYHGRGVEQDEAKAAEMYQRGADMGHAPCQANLASMYILGEGGLEVDQLKGRALAVASAEQNDFDGMRIVAALEGRFNPNGGPVDLMIGEFFRRGIEKGILAGNEEFDEFIQKVQEAAEAGDALAIMLYEEIGDAKAPEDEDKLFIDFAIRAKREGRLPADLPLDGMEELMSMDVFIECLNQYLEEGDEEAEELMEVFKECIGEYLDEDTEKGAALAKLLDLLDDCDE